MSAKTSTPISTIENVLVDTSAWFALIDKREKNHEVADRFFTQEERYRYVTTDFIIDETITMARKKIGHEAAVQIGKMLFSEDMIRVIHVAPSLQEEALGLLEKFHDKLFSFTDCTSFAVMNRFSICRAFCFDADFKQAGFISLP